MPVSPSGFGGTAQPNGSQALCRCGPDPWLCCCSRAKPALTDHAVDGWHMTAQHLLDIGCTPLVPAQVLRALHKRGGDHQKVAQQLYEPVGSDGV